MTTVPHTLHILLFYRALTDVNAKHAVLREIQQDISSKYVTIVTNTRNAYIYIQMTFLIWSLLIVSKLCYFNARGYHLEILGI